MKILKIPKKKLDLFASILRQNWQIHAPVEQNGKFAFKPLMQWSEARLNYNRTILSPKKYFLPPQETMFSFSPTEGYVPNREGLDEKVILFGVHPCDIFAINILDEVFAGKYTDPYYQIRRQNTAIIGVSCVPDEFCFCRSMRADCVDKGFDLFFDDIGEYYLTMVGTSRGDDLVVAASQLFEAITEEDITEYKHRSSEKREAFKLHVEIRDLPEIFEIEYKSEIWDELGDRCLSCGNCSMVCPTCYCYDVVDRVDLGSKAGPRVRNWDSCLFHNHALVSGGENFREQRSSRIKHRYYHKQRGFVAEFGRPSCIGCGRCIESCPVRIDIVEVLNRLRGEEHAVH
jgi:sulfhydrogenase subunit beta (sulfur reductase)